MKKQDYTYVYIIVFIVVAIVIYRSSAKRRVLRKARSFVGQEETGSNKGFKNARFSALMQKAGWFKGAQWCAFFTRMVWLNALPNRYKTVAEKLLSGSSQQTYLNFKNDKSGLFQVSDRPKKGSIVVWQATRDATRGHVGIVTDVSRNTFKTIEGNSNVGGHPGIVSRLEHSFTKSPDGLKLRGFINLR